MDKQILGEIFEFQCSILCYKSYFVTYCIYTIMDDAFNHIMIEGNITIISYRLVCCSV